MDPIQLLLHSPKGGVGKSLLSILAAEYFSSRKFTVNLKDASGNPTARRFIDGSVSLGRTNNLSATNANVTIIDTKGIPSSAVPFYDSASLIIAPFKPSADDALETLDFYNELSSQHQRKVIFIANCLRALGNTKEQHQVIDGVRDQAKDNGGLLLFGLVDRPAIYPRIPLGLRENFFEMNVDIGSFKKAQDEACKLFGDISSILDIRE